MRSIIVDHQDATPRLAELSEPRPGPGEVSIRVHACGLNFADLLMISGKYQETPPWPFALGMEVAGEIAAVGPDVTGWTAGQPVVAFCGHGGLAEVVAVPAARCVALPAGADMVTGAAFPIAYGTSHLALTDAAGLTAGETLVVTGAAGGVGLTAVEIGRLLGARVVAVARGAEKLAVARTAGAEHLIDSDTADLRAEVKALGGADVVYDAVGDPGFSQLLRATRPGGRLLAIGFAGGKVPQIPANLLLVKNLRVIGFYWGGHMAFARDRLTASLGQLAGWLAAGRLKPHVGTVLPLERAAEGLELLRNRRAIGKVVITC